MLLNNLSYKVQIGGYHGVGITGGFTYDPVEGGEAFRGFEISPGIGEGAMLEVQFEYNTGVGPIWHF